MRNTWVPEGIRRIVERLREDVRAALENDPAARSAWEVVLCYPGVHALWLHRVAHFLWQRRRYLLARLVSHLNRALTGVEIHPGARIGRRVFIDHGMGVVIGETAEVGNDVILYQGVVLGGTSRQRTKRHPTVCDGVVIGAGAILLGPITVGEHARIGAGSVVVRSVPAHATVVGVPAHVARLGNGARPETALEHNRITDPVASALEEISHRYLELEERIARLERRLGEGACAEEEVPVPSLLQEPDGRE
ncbi:MAG: serine O-acetyltransferase [Thermoflexia bacterium]|nr:MAG: serine O-acetyltransferase [Thermoflexia bacterium]